MCTAYVCMYSMYSYTVYVYIAHMFLYTFFSYIFTSIDLLLIVVIISPGALPCQRQERVVSMDFVVLDHHVLVAA